MLSALCFRGLPGVPQGPDCRILGCKLLGYMTLLVHARCLLVPVRAQRLLPLLAFEPSLADCMFTTSVSGSVISV